MLPKGRGIRTAALENTEPGLKFQRSLAPNIHFAEEAKIGGGPQFVDLNADGLTDLVGYHIDDKGNEIVNVALLNVKGKWQPAPALKLPKPMSSDKAGQLGMFVDVNSDGLPDFVHAPKGEAPQTWKVKFDSDGNAVGWTPINTYNLPNTPAGISSFSEEKFGDRGVRFLDLNADGRVDILIGRREHNNKFARAAFLNTGSGWTAASSQFLPPVPFVSRDAADVHYETKGSQGDYYRDLRISQVDLNGDGLLDLAFWYGHKAPSTSGTKYTPKKHGCLNLDEVDSNGNVTTAHPIATSKFCAGAYLNTGNGWTPWLDAGGKQIFPPIQLDVSIEKPHASIDTADINGDGLVDFVHSVLESGSNKGSAYLSTGLGWTASSELTLPKEVLSSNQKLMSHRILDINGDGLLDVTFSRQESSSLVGGTYFNSGNGWIAQSSLAPKEAFINEKGEDLGVRLVDVDGNGLPDLLRSWKDKGGALTETAYLNVGSRQDILQKVTNGLGATTRLEYRSLLTPRQGTETDEERFYTPSPISAYPTISHVPTMYAVERMLMDESDGSTTETRYRYKGFRFNVIAGMPLGFEERTAQAFVNSKPSISETIRFHQDYFRNGRSKEEQSSFKDGAEPTQVLSKSIKTYDVVDTPGVSWPKRVLMSEVENSNFDLKGVSLGTTREFYAFDRFSNATSVCIEYGDGSRTLTKNTYDNGAALTSLDKWYLGRLTVANVTHTRTKLPIECVQLLTGLSGVPPNEQLTNTAKFGYDRKTGVLTFEEANSGHPLSVRKTYKHDQFGNTIQTTLSAKDENPRTQISSYDILGRFSIQSQNALGHVASQTYDELLGLIISATDPNGVIVKSVYDGFGRRVETKSPTGLLSVTKRSFAAGVDAVRVFDRSAAYTVTQQVGTLPETKTYFDEKGRKLRTKQEGFTKAEAPERFVFQDTKFDARGRIIEATLPYYEGDPVYTTTTSYDELNRPRFVVAPDTGQTETRYEGLQTTLIDPNGRTSKKIQSLKGLTVSTVDDNGSELQFIYGPGDRLLKTIQVDGLELINEYNEIGNKIASHDPNLGVWNYRYNAYGEIVWQRDAKGQETYIDYDLLGRPLRRSMADNIETFTYDKSRSGVGKPHTVRNTQGYRARYFYDKLGRLKRKETRIDQDIYRLGLSYDDHSRVVTTFHPGNFRTTNVYDRFGYRSRILANDPTASLLDGDYEKWSVVERDQFGRVTEERNANGVVTSHAYDPTKGSLVKLTVQKGVRKLSDLRLEYDLVGNLQKKNDVTSRTKETYQYDNLYRLTSWKKNRKTRAKYRYDTAGRITFKSGVGSYRYDAAGPAHGVREIRFRGKKYRYQYDPNGNMTFSRKGRFEYYANNLVKVLYKSNDLWSRFRYAPDGTRYHHHFSQSRKIKDMSAPYSTVLTTMVGAYEKIEDRGSAFGVAAHGYVRHRLHLSTDTGATAILEHSTQYDPLHGYAARKRKYDGKPISIALEEVKEHFLHKDHLGSIVRVSDRNGKIVSGYTYDPWGERKQTIYKGWKRGNDFAQGSFRRGFTGHEHLENLNLVHMNGRVYDPTIARFVSADPTLQFPLSGQSYNRYSYVHNNPLSFIDPTGFFIKKLFKAVGNALGAILSPVAKAFDWLRKNWKQVVVAVVAVAITVVTGGIGGAILAGAVAGGMSTALHGGDWNDIFEAALKGAIAGAVTGGVASGAEYAGFQTYAAYGANSIAGGIAAEVQGGDFWSGFASAAVSRVAAGNLTSQQSHISTKIAVSAAVGGTVSEISGGKFANGAVTAAMATLMTEYAKDYKSNEGRPLTKEEREIAQKYLGKDFDIDLDKVRLVRGKFSVLQPSGRAMSPNGNIYFPKSNHAGCLNFALCSSVGAVQDFVHEMTHVGQYQQGTNVFLRGAVLQTADQLGFRVYQPKANVPFSRQNLEAQGTLMERNVTYPTP